MAKALKPGLIVAAQAAAKRQNVPVSAVLRELEKNPANMVDAQVRPAGLGASKTATPAKPSAHRPAPAEKPAPKSLADAMASSLSNADINALIRREAFPMPKNVRQATEWWWSHDVIHEAKRRGFID